MRPESTHVKRAPKRAAAEAYVAGTAITPLGSYEVSERELAVRVIREAAKDADVGLGEIDGLYMPKPRPWAEQNFFSTALIGYLGMDLARNVELYTGGTSGAKALHVAVSDVRSGRVEAALVVAVERNSVGTKRYFEYVLSLFDREFVSPFGPSVPGVYAQSLQRYLYEYDVDREDVASVVVKNRDNGAKNPDSIFESSTDVASVLDSEPIADPLRLYECPRLCDGAAALVVTSEPAGPKVAGTGHHHPPSHFGVTDVSTATLPAAKKSAEEALSDAGASIDDVDVLELYAPFPHIEAILTEELGYFERGDGAKACAMGETRPDGAVPVSPSGGCLGRGHPALVTPILNHVEAIEQLRGEAVCQVPNAEIALTTSEHGHVDGMTTTIFERGQR